MVMTIVIVRLVATMALVMIMVTAMMFDDNI